MNDRSGGLLEQRLRIDGRTVRVLESGAGAPVVLVHGLGLSAGIWRPHLQRLAAAGYRTIAPDLPGFGESPGPWTGLSVARAARWLRTLADALDIEQAAWIGHSVGAQQVVRLAVTAPERVAALVLAAPTGRAGRHGLAQLSGLLLDAFRERPGLVAGVIRRYLGGPLATAGTWIRSVAHDTALDAPRVKSPVLLVRGGADPVVRPAFIDLLQRLLEDAEMHEVEDAAHAVALDPVTPFTNAVVGFLDRRYRLAVRGPDPSPDP